MIHFKTLEGDEVWLKESLVEAITLTKDGAIRVWIDIVGSHYFDAVDTYRELLG